LDLFTPEDIRKYFYTSCFLAIICLILALVAIGESGYANTIEQTIIGKGDIYTRHDSQSASDLASAINSTLVYEAKREWTGESESQQFSSSFIVTGAQASGGYRNQYVVKSSGAGYKHVYRATQISGDFAGQGDVSLTIGEDGAESLDSLVLMDSRNGNATFQGRIYSSVGGRPITAEEMDAVGQLMIRSYLNISQTIDKPVGWLDFCGSLNRLIDPAVAPGIYVAPPGYVLDETGNLKKKE
jgi:hypothetical protein